MITHIIFFMLLALANHAIAMFDSLPHSSAPVARSTTNAGISSARTFYKFLYRKHIDDLPKETLEVKVPGSRPIKVNYYFAQNDRISPVQIYVGPIGSQLTYNSLGYMDTLSRLRYRKDSPSEYDNNDQLGYHFDNRVSFIVWDYPETSWGALKPEHVRAALDAITRLAMGLDDSDGHRRRPRPVEYFALCYGAAPALEIAHDERYRQHVRGVYVVGGYLSYNDYSKVIPRHYSEYNLHPILAKQETAWPFIYWLHSIDDPTINFKSVSEALKKYSHGGRKIQIFELEGSAHLPNVNVSARAFALMREYSRSQDEDGLPKQIPNDIKRTVFAKAELPKDPVIEEVEMMELD